MIGITQHGPVQEIRLQRPPVNALNDELLEALAPQIGSARGREAGGRPVMLLNGRRISSFRELRDIPPEERLRLVPPVIIPSEKPGDRQRH